MWTPKVYSKQRSFQAFLIFLKKGFEISCSRGREDVEIRVKGEQGQVSSRSCNYGPV